ncbi:RND family efflux transporter MFP subunit [Phreatobacter oligotrophus]|uniref:RND family efflux transporter MFP subunit n=1 Tax=Phreatobacter oligotrophus TaxID=1122261 RepID=A0A2T4YLC2_9HYPH|nr:RND family efflux transporter MFP subunit [Phreatobacter oligotrophus]
MSRASTILSYAAFVLVALNVPAMTQLAESTSRSSSRPIIRLDDQAVRAAGIQLSPIQPESGATDLSFPGMVAVPPQQIRVVAAPAAGLIETVLVAPDETVRQGQVIATMRSPELIEAQRGFLTAIADESLAQDRLRRSRSLHESRVIPERDLRVAETEATNAAAKLDEQIQLLKLIGMADEGVETLRRTRRLMASIEMRAPIDGVVTIRHASAGERVVASAPIFTIADLSPLWVNIQVPATRLGALQVGSRVILPTQGAQGRVIRIGRTVDAATQSVAVVAEVDTNGGSVRPGLAVNVSVRVEQNGLAQWLAPSSGVVRHRDRTWVFTRNASGFLAVPVQVVAETARGVAFRADLAPGTEIATRGLLALVAELSETGEE